MTVENTNPIQHFTANGETPVFAISFAVEGKDNIKVTVNGSVVSVNDYSYDALTKAVVFNTAPVEGTEVVVERVTSLDRSINYQTYDNSFRPETLNYDLDRIWCVLQEQNIIDAEILARLKDEIDWRIAHDNQVLANIDNEADQRRLVDERIREEIAQEVEARRTLDLNYDTLAQIRDLQVFGALKQYLDTIIASTSPNVFGGVTAGVVFALDQKSVQTHLEDIYQKIVEERQAFQAEESRAKAAENSIDQRAKSAEQVLDQKIATETNRAKAEEGTIKASVVVETNRSIAVEQTLQNQINAVGVGNKAYLTYADMTADQANISYKSKVTVTNDPTSSKNGDYQFDGTNFTRSAYDPITQAKNYTNEVKNDIDLKIEEVNENFLIKSDRSGYLTGFSTHDGKMLLGFRNEDGRAIFGVGGDIVADVQNVSSTVSEMYEKIDKPRSNVLTGFITPNGQLPFYIESSTGKPILAGVDVLAKLEELASRPIQEVETTQIFPDENIAAWGDSLTANGSSGDWLKKVGTATGRDVYNGGIGGQGSKSIAARQGGVPVRFSAFTIPATITAVTVTPNEWSPCSKGGSAIQLTIKGITGNLQRSLEDVHTFTRLATGQEVLVPNGTVGYSVLGETYKTRLQIIGSGRNSISTMRPQELVTVIKAMLDYQDTRVKRAIVWGIPYFPNDSATNKQRVDDMNNALAETFPEFWLDIPAWLCSSTPKTFGYTTINDPFTVLGITPTAQDLTDITNKLTPISLRSSETDGHFNQNCGTAIAYRIQKELEIRGWN